MSYWDCALVTRVAEASGLLAQATAVSFGGLGQCLCIEQGRRATNSEWRASLALMRGLGCSKKRLAMASRPRGLDHGLPLQPNLSQLMFQHANHLRRRNSVVFRVPPPQLHLFGT